MFVMYLKFIIKKRVNLTIPTYTINNLFSYKTLTYPLFFYYLNMQPYLLEFFNFHFMNWVLSKNKNNYFIIIIT